MKLRWAITIVFCSLCLHVQAAETANGTSQSCRQFVIKNATSRYQGCLAYLKREARAGAPLPVSAIFGQKLWLPFLRNVAAGDAQSLMVAFMYAPLSDGAEAEELARNMAKTIVKTPKQFLAAVHSSGIDPAYLPGIVLATPLNYVDHVKKGIALDKRRLAAIETVDEPGLKPTRQAVAQILEDDIREME